MSRIPSRRATLTLLAAALVTMSPTLLHARRTATATAAAQISENDVVEAYHYMLGRWLVLRQQNRDFRDEGLRWNDIKHREPGGVAWANPNLDVAYSEAWIGIDENSCTLITLPEIKGRYYTVQVLNGWGEVTANINERTYPRHPFGTFGLCLKGAKVTLPPGTQRVDLPNKASRILTRVELGADPAGAVALQKQITMRPTGSPRIAEPVVRPDFPNDRLPGVEGFDGTDEILASEPDINKGMAAPQRKARAVAKAAADPQERSRIDDIIRKQAIPAFYAAVHKPGPVKNGWAHPRVFGNYGSDYLGRSVVNFAGIWANNSGEAVYFGNIGLDGGQTYTQTFSRDALPAKKARYFWSVIAVDGEKFMVIPNRLNRYLLNNQSPLTLNADGSLTLAFAPTLPEGIHETNWLPTPEGKTYNLTFRFYGPSKDVSAGAYFPPPLVGRDVPRRASNPPDHLR